MKRPLAVTGFSFLAALAAALYIGTEFLLWGILIFALLAGAGLLIKRVRRNIYIPAVLLSSLCALLVLGAYTQLAIKPCEVIKGKTASVTAQICDLPYYQNGSVCYKLMASEITAADGTTVRNARIRLYSGEVLNAEPYDEISCVALFSSKDNDYLTAKGIKLSGSIKRNEKVTVKKADSYPPEYYILRLRSSIQDTISSLLPQDKAVLVSAIITGSKSELPEELTDAFRSSGVAHITSVSGFHISVFTAFCLALLRLLLKGKKRIAALLCMVTVLLYMMVAGFSPSVSRAGIMQIIVLLGMVVRREADSLNSLGASVIIITLINPYSAVDASLLLSFSATLGIILLAPVMSRHIRARLTDEREKISFRDKLFCLFRRGLMLIVNVFTVSVSAFLFTLPVMVFCFHRIALYSVAANMLIAPMLSVLIVCVIIMVLLSMSVMFSFLALPFVFVCAVLTDWIVGISGFVASLPMSVIDASSIAFAVWVILSVSAGAVLYALRSKHRAVQIYSLAVTLTFAAIVFVSMIVDIDTVRLYISSVGNGVSLAAVQNGEAYVFSCGGSSSGFASFSGALESGRVKQIGYLLLSGGNHTSEYAGKLLQKYHVLNAEVYDEEGYSETIHRGLLKADDLLLRHSEDGISHTAVLPFGRAICSSDGKAACILTELEGASLLICTDGTDCSLLPEEFRKCDIIVINGSVRNLHEVTYGTLIVSGGITSESELPVSGDKYILSTLDGGIIIKTENNGFTIGREEDWQS